MRLHAIKSFYTERQGFVTLEDDVLSIVRQVREHFEDRVTVELDETSGEYYFVEHCSDGTDRLIFATPDLDGRTLERLLLADSQGRGYEDPYDRAERAQDEALAAIDQQKTEELMEHGERLAHALKKDGRAERLPLVVPITRKPHADS